MDKITVIFPGWGSTFSFYKKYLISKLNLGEILYIDLNNENVFNDKYKDNLKERLKAYDNITFFAWSLGTIIALKWEDEFEQELKIDKNILISPTLNFTKTTSPIILKKMIRDLKRDKTKVLRKFIKMNFFKKRNYLTYIKRYKKEIYNLNDNSLKKGLNILLKEKVNISKIISESLILTGDKDIIIPRKNTEIFLNKFENYKYKYYNECGHNILYEKNDEILDLIRSFLDDRKKISS